MDSKIISYIQSQGTSPCLKSIEESEYDFSKPRNVVAKINFAKEYIERKKENVKQYNVLVKREK